MPVCKTISAQYLMCTGAPQKVTVYAVYAVSSSLRRETSIDLSTNENIARCYLDTIACVGSLYVNTVIVSMTGHKTEVLISKHTGIHLSLSLSTLANGNGMADSRNGVYLTLTEKSATQNCLTE